MVSAFLSRHSCWGRFWRMQLPWSHPYSFNLVTLWLCSVVGSLTRVSRHVLTSRWEWCWTVWWIKTAGTLLQLVIWDDPESMKEEWGRNNDFVFSQLLPLTHILSPFFRSPMSPAKWKRIPYTLGLGFSSKGLCTEGVTPSSQWEDHEDPVFSNELIPCWIWWHYWELLGSRR